MVRIQIDFKVFVFENDDRLIYSTIFTARKNRQLYGMKIIINDFSSVFFDKLKCIYSTISNDFSCGLYQTESA